MATSAFPASQSTRSDRPLVYYDEDNDEMHVSSVRGAAAGAASYHADAWDNPHMYSTGGAHSRASSAGSVNALQSSGRGTQPARYQVNPSNMNFNWNPMGDAHETYDADRDQHVYDNDPYAAPSSTAHAYGDSNSYDQRGPYNQTVSDDGEVLTEAEFLRRYPHLAAHREEKQQAPLQYVKA